MACLARLRVLKKRAAQSQTSARTGEEETGDDMALLSRIAC
jgi:hypothetical protein